VTIDALLLSPLTWLVAALAILLIDVFLAFVLLPFSLAALLLVALTFADQRGAFGVTLLHDWQDVALAYGIAALLGVIALRRLLRRGQRGSRDINDY
jgi:Cu/Ag efflux pump CusA